MRRILVTGAGTWVGGRLVRRLERIPGTEVFPVDAVEPRVPFESEFFRTSLDQLPFAAYLLESRPDTVIHLQTLDRSAEIGRARSHEQVVVGAQALFGAILRCEQVQHVVVKSGSDVYGATTRSPSVHPEDETESVRRSRYQRDLIEVEDFVRKMAARQPDVSYTILRLAPILGPNVDNALSRYIRLPVVPTIAGFDPRLQFLHEEDAVGALVHAASHPVAGTFNVAGAGQLYLSRILRLGLRPSQPLPRRAFKAAARGLSRLDIALLPHLIALLEHGRVMETGRMQTQLGFRPRFNCRQTVLATYRRLPESALSEDPADSHG